MQNNEQLAAAIQFAKEKLDSIEPMILMGAVEEIMNRSNVPRSTQNEIIAMISAHQTYIRDMCHESYKWLNIIERDLHKPTPEIITKIYELNVDRVKKQVDEIVTEFRKLIDEKIKSAKKEFPAGGIPIPDRELGSQEAMHIDSMMNDIRHMLKSNPLNKRDVREQLIHKVKRIETILKRNLGDEQIINKNVWGNAGRTIPFPDLDEQLKNRFRRFGQEFESEIVFINLGREAGKNKVSKMN